jgi:hypothetical protein
MSEKKINQIFRSYDETETISTEQSYMRTFYLVLFAITHGLFA